VLQHSDVEDGNIENLNFTIADVPDGCMGQDVETFDESSFAAIGQSPIGNRNGVAASTDNGITWDWFNITELKTQARYGAFPSTTTWYVAAGQFPDGSDEAELSGLKLVRSISQDTHIVQDAKTGEVKPLIHRFTSAADSADVYAFAAQIVKSTDGGATWTSQFYKHGFYFNQIGCSSETHCCAVAGGGDNFPGTRIMCTWDGTNWNTTFVNSNQYVTAIGMTFVSENEGWVSGGDMQGFKGSYWHTLDGGNTWTELTVDGVYGMDLSFPTATAGFGTAFTFLQTSAFVKYLPNGDV